VNFEKFELQNIFIDNKSHDIIFPCTLFILSYGSIKVDGSSFELLVYRTVNKGRNLYHLLQLSMFDGPLMLWVNWPVVDTIHP